MHNTALKNEWTLGGIQPNFSLLTFIIGTTIILEENMSTVSKASSRGGNPYKNSEDQKIIQWIIKQSRYSEVGGIKMWEILESCNEVPGRSYQSMKERFRKNIMPNIQHYQLEKDQVDRFRMYSQGSKSKAKKKK